MGLIQQREYPQIYIAREIRESLRYPSAPVEPKKPQALDLPIPVKYPSLADNLQMSGIFLIGGLGLGLLSFFISNWIIILILALCGVGVVLGLCLSILSLLQSKTFNDRLSAYNEAKKNYEHELELYKEQSKVYLQEKKKYEEHFKTSKEILDYRLAQRQEFLHAVKTKERHAGFYESGSSNPKKGRAEYFFRDYIEDAKSKGLISDDFDFLYDTAVPSMSGSGMKAWDFYPDILVLTPRGLLVDIEIDEPYVSETKEPIHYYEISESGRDSFRNDYFTKFNCSVIRFSERQIMIYPEICLEIIRSFDDYGGISPCIQLPDDFKEKIWSKEEAIKMAKDNYRDNY